MDKAIIVDLDGTLCNIDHRKKYIDGSMGKKDWDKFYSLCDNDSLNNWCFEILRAFSSHNVMFRDTSMPSYYFLAVTGRPEKYRTITGDWLVDYCSPVPFETLYMRPDGDFRKDTTIKKEVYYKYIKDSYDVLFAIDDRQQVVDMWRRERLVCLQCDKGDF